MDGFFDGSRVSDEWDVILTAARRDGVQFHLNSGRRTISEQWRLYRLWRAGVGAVAAFPSPAAPHIRTGRADHAIDVSTIGGGEHRLQEYLNRHALGARNTVAGEPWHLEAASEVLLKRAAAKLNIAPEPTLRKGSIDRLAVRRLQRILRALGYRSVTVNGRYDLRTRRVVRRFQRRHGLKVDGVVGHGTWRKLNERIRSSA